MALSAEDAGAVTSDSKAVTVGTDVSGKTFKLSGNSYMLLSRLNVHNHLKFTVTTASASDKFGFSFARGTDSEKFYSMVMNPESDTKRKLNFEEEGGIGFVNGIDSYVFDTPADYVYNVTVCTDNSVCTVYVNDVLAYTNRIYGTQKNCWSINCYGGDITVSDIEVKYY